MDFSCWGPKVRFLGYLGAILGQNLRDEIASTLQLKAEDFSFTMEMLRQENLNLSLGNKGQKKYLAKLSRFIPRRLAMVVEEKGG